MSWSPMGFIRQVDGAGDRQLHAQHLTRTIDEHDDLRFLGYLDDGDEAAVFAERLPWDSEFFGYGVGRLNGIFPLAAPWYRPTADYGPVVGQLVDLARRRNLTYLFAVVDPQDLATLRALAAHGFSLIETRVFYHLDLTDYTYPERFPVRAATPQDVDALARTAREMVNPFDRFHADPFIDRADADRLMERWVSTSVVENFADVTIVPDSLDPTAFCTVRYHKDHWESWGLRLAQPVFSAVGPEFKGWYRRIISEINYHLHDEVGAEHSYLVTQITNTAVTWVWESLGYRLGKGEHVMRLIL